MYLFIKELLLLLGSISFIICLKLLSSPKTAKTGNSIGFIGMFIIICVLFFDLSNRNQILTTINLIISSVIGTISAKKIKMTAMPQMVAIFNGLGGAASMLVAICELLNMLENKLDFNNYNIIFSFFSIIIGAITFSGSLIAFLKLQELITNNCVIIIFHKLITTMFTIINICIVFYLCNQKEIDLIKIMIIISTLSSILLGILLVIPIGGADMPVVISLLNSYSGIAACLAGFLINNKVLIISGSLVGASGIILTNLMCQAMNRSLNNVVFGAFKTNKNKAGTNIKEYFIKEYKPIDAAILLKNSENIIIIPGYGLAVSQAQHNIKELANILIENGSKIKYAIHPVAGRMPGHMNVLLAEADISYEQLYDIEEINHEFENTDVVLIIGANDVVNPAARTDKNSPLYGMPILNADKAKNIIVFKRGRGKGFSGVENELFYMEKTATVFGDAKKTIISLVNEIKKI